MSENVAHVVDLHQRLLRRDGEAAALGTQERSFHCGHWQVGPSDHRRKLLPVFLVVHVCLSLVARLPAAKNHTVRRAMDQSVA